MRAMLIVLASLIVGVISIPVVITYGIPDGVVLFLLLEPTVACFTGWWVTNRESAGEKVRRLRAVLVTYLHSFSILDWFIAGMFILVHLMLYPRFGVKVMTELVVLISGYSVVLYAHRHNFPPARWLRVRDWLLLMLFSFPVWYEGGIFVDTVRSEILSGVANGFILICGYALFLTGMSRARKQLIGEVEADSRE